jgi:hypothetical protein
MDDWSSEETDDPVYADRRNFYKVEKWSKDGMRVVELLFAGTDLDKARRIFHAHDPASATHQTDYPACARREIRNTMG